MLHKYVLFKHVYVAGIRWNYTLHKYVLFRHLYVPDIRCNHTFYFNVYTLRIYVAIILCNYTFGPIRVYVHFCTYTLYVEIAYTCICGPVYVAEYGGFVHIYAIFAKHVYVL